MSDTITFSADELSDLIVAALVASNTGDGSARSVARALVAAECDGRKGHGFSRVPTYAGQARSGKVDGRAVPSAERSTPGVLRVDANLGFFYPAMDLVFERLPAMARETGIAAAAIARSHHCGVIGHHVERFADEGLVALFVANTPKAMAPWGGTQAVFGTNPLAFAAPRRDGPPMVIDLALSQVARGNILTAAQAGKPIPEGWAFDADGKPTTDPEAALQGTLLPVGGAKGSALALMVEILEAPLIGASLSTEATSFFTPDGAPPAVGQFLIVLDPDAFAGRESYLDRIEQLFAGITAQEGARLPGARGRALREAARRDGLTVPAKLVDEVREIAAGRG